MTNLAQRLLASIDVHVMSLVTGIQKLYTHEKPEDIEAALTELKTEGWIKISYRSVQLGPSKKEKRPYIVRRTDKKLYDQQTLFNDV